ncbi:serine/threonine protein kinase [Nannizzia gypsea CBS 118893]|uniref:non-specific serine/threonine protein kinase n=1 Tax=Arthroderma gypseum (strain ATCC MYA-4604 / CBS 118893) TaxID=535722 RepID=E4V1T2_ARTGP|nr:serine/threonine protein kinase [Nannizzia gypsea CBS 118893]EFR03997.1 serine/threonine protein kinase [Nannizzia gypsea CBS 118893]
MVLSSPSTRTNYCQRLSSLQLRAFSSSHLPTETPSNDGVDVEPPYIEYDWIDGAESLSQYQPGGYHPVIVGDMVHDRYRIVDKLGFGGYATIWLARDSQLEYTRSEWDAPMLHDDPAQCNLWEASYSRLFPIDVARALSAAVTLSVASIHSRGFVHGAKFPSSFDNLSVEKFYEEYGKPETVPVTRSDGAPLSFGKYAEDFTLSDTHVLLSDFGEAFSPTSESRLGKGCRTPLHLRPPEARFEPDTPMSYPADIWGSAVAIWEIVGMKAIWSCEFATPDSVTKQHIEVLGPMPTDKEETVAFLDLMRQMLVFRPKERPTALQVLESDWMVNWALPGFERGLND